MECEIFDQEVTDINVGAKEVEKIKNNLKKVRFNVCVNGCTLDVSHALINARDVMQARTYMFSV